MLDLWDDEDAIERVFLLNNVRFYVRIFADKLQSPGDLLRQLNTFASDINAPENMNGFEDWVLNAMEAVTGALASASPTRNSVPLLNFFSPKTYAFELVNNEGRLCPQQVDYAPGEYLRTTPRVHVVDELPHDERRPRPPAWVFGGRRLAQRQDTILRSDVPRVPYSHFLASELIKVDDDLEDLDLCYPPHTVRHVGTENFFFFKQTFNGDGLRRELDILNQINTMTEPVRTSKLVGLVFWDGEEEDVLMGFLLDYVEGSTLAAVSQDSPPDKKNGLGRFSRLCRPFTKMASFGEMPGPATS